MICANCGMDKHHLQRVCPHCRKAKPVGIKIAQTREIPQAGWMCNARVLQKKLYNSGLQVMSDAVPCDTINTFSVDRCSRCEQDRGTKGVALV